MIISMKEPLDFIIIIHFQLSTFILSFFWNIRDLSLELINEQLLTPICDCVHIFYKYNITYKHLYYLLCLYCIILIYINIFIYFFKLENKFEGIADPQISSGIHTSYVIGFGSVLGISGRKQCVFHSAFQQFIPVSVSLRVW